MHFVSLWDEPNSCVSNIHVSMDWFAINCIDTCAQAVCVREELPPPTELPITAPRPKGHTGVAFASQAFNVEEVPGRMSSWISGYMELPPGAIKDAEGVGSCCQVFTVAKCQENTCKEVLLMMLVSLFCSGIGVGRPCGWGVGRRDGDEISSLLWRLLPCTTRKYL